MPRSERAPSFQFYPADYLCDPAVAAMTFDERGRYWWALCRSWQTEKPGQATEAQWRRWMDYSDDEWPAHRDSLAAAFKVRPDGKWIQKRTVLTRSSQRERQKQAQRGANATNEKRWGSVAQRPVERPDSDRYGVTPSSSSSSSSTQEQEQKHNGSDSHAPDGARNWKDLTPEEQRSEWFDFGMPPPNPTLQDCALFASVYPKPTTVKMISKAMGEAVRRNAKDTDRGYWSGPDALELIEKARQYARSVAGKDVDYLPDAARWLDEDRFALIDLDDEDERDD